MRKTITHSIEVSNSAVLYTLREFVGTQMINEIQMKQEDAMRTIDAFSEYATGARVCEVYEKDELITAVGRAAPLPVIKFSVNLFGHEYSVSGASEYDVFSYYIHDITINIKYQIAVKCSETAVWYTFTDTNKSIIKKGSEYFVESKLIASEAIEPSKQSRCAGFTPDKHTRIDFFDEKYMWIILIFLL